MFSAFRLGKLAGGGMRLLAATLPKLWSPCLAATERNTDFRDMVVNKVSLRT